MGRVGTRALRWALRRLPRWGVAPPTTLLASLAGGLASLDRARPCQI